MSLVIREIQIKTVMIWLYLLIYLKKKIAGAGNSAEQPELPYFADGNSELYNNFGKQPDMLS